MELHLLRHTRPDVPRGVCYGQEDVGLSDSYNEESRDVKKRVQSPYDRVFCSPLQRCARLARDLREGEPHPIDALKELHFGEWEGRAWEDIPQEELSRWMSDFSRESPPRGESLEMLYERVEKLLEEFRKEKEGKHLLVTHGGVIRCCWAYVLKFPLDHIFRLDLPYGSLSRLHFDDKGPGIHKVGLG